LLSDIGPLTSPFPPRRIGSGVLVPSNVAGTACHTLSCFVPVSLDRFDELPRKSDAAGSGSRSKEVVLIRNRPFCRRGEGRSFSQGESVMKRWLFCCMGVAVCGLTAVSLSELSAADKDKVTPIDEIMEKAHKKGDGILPAIGKELQGAKVNWDAVESKTKDLLLLAGDLGKNTPPKGEKVSWDKLTKAYVTNVEGLQKAAESKDVAKAKASQKALAGSCTACHSRHKG
jgi:hypothetical protein